MSQIIKQKLVSAALSVCAAFSGSAAYVAAEESDSYRNGADYNSISEITEFVRETAESPIFEYDGAIADKNPTEDKANPEVEDKSSEKKFIKWAQFDVPYDALNRAYNYCIKGHEAGKDFDWIELLTLLAVKYYGNWKSYKSKDLDAMYQLLQSGENMDKYTKNKNYNYYKEVYNAVLSEYVGNYKLTIKDGEDEREVEKYGLKVYSPIADGYYFGHCDDFGNARGYGFKRKHLGHDMMGSNGTPIIAIESGYIEEMGWNQYGGWRIGIRSFDKKRYYYYAHLRKDHPFNNKLKKGDNVNAGDVIGYMGRTGYSKRENTNNIKITHLHLGVQLIFDESQKEAVCELWIDVYPLARFLQKNKSTVVFDKESNEYVRKHGYTALTENLRYFKHY